MSTPTGSSRAALAEAGAPGAGVAAPLRAGASQTPVVARHHPARDYFVRRALAAADLLAVLVMGTLVLMSGTSDAATSSLLLVLATLPAWLVLFRLYGLYDRDVKAVRSSALDDLGGLFHAFVIGTLGLWACQKVLHGQGLTVAEALTFGLGGVVLASTLRIVARRAMLAFSGPSRVLVVGSSPLVEALVRKMRAHPEYALDPVGQVSPNGGVDGVSDLQQFGRLPELDLRSLVGSRRIERVIVEARELSDESMIDLIHDCGAAGAKVSILPDHVNALGPSVAVEDIEGVTVLGLNPLILSNSSRFLKRSLDICGALAGLLVAAPVLAALAIAIQVDSPGPVLFRQRRIGRGDRPFTVLKFRTMVADAEARTDELRSLSDDPDWLKLDRDPRVTRVGHLLRATSLDELPQLWNVLRGQMSLVGPRPLIDSEDARIAGWSRIRLELAPGVTGLWQVMGRTDIPFRDMLSLDYLYVTNWSLWLDVKLIARTVPAVLARRGAN